MKTTKNEDTLIAGLLRQYYENEPQDDAATVELLQRLKFAYDAEDSDLDLVAITKH